MSNERTVPESQQEIMDQEVDHLSGVLGMLHEAKSEALAMVGKTEDNYQNMKSYMVDYRGEIDPSESYQNELFLQVVDQRASQASSALERYEKLLDSPYFARVDFIPGQAPEPLIAYIGRFSFSHGTSSVISDWRSPIAGLFYDYDIGEAAYQAPAGTVEGELTRKRQIEIGNGVLRYAADTDSNVRDEVLLHEIGKSSDQKMKTIVASIQREQNAIIRDEDSGSLIIQGVAGSGKTSIALHRVAYLLYRKKDRLSSNSVAILSPNKVFGDYVSKVLPELGEEPIAELYLREIYEKILGDTVEVGQPYSLVDDKDLKCLERIRYRGTLAFADEVSDYLSRATEGLFVGEDISFGRHKIEGSRLDQRFYSYGDIPINERINLLASDVLHELQTNLFSIGSWEMPSRTAIKTKLSKMLVFRDALSLYKQFFRDLGVTGTAVASSKKVIAWEDACPLILFKGFYEGLEIFSSIEHLVIDEMQDLTPIQQLMIARLFPCEKTILGDYYQMVDTTNEMTLDALAARYPQARVIKLLRSYRSTFEIMELAKKVGRAYDIEPVARHGEEPRVIACANTQEVLDQLDKALVAFQAKGHQTLGILHKSEAIAARYYELLSRDHDVHLISQESTTYEGGISLSSIQMAKGLEFDEVIVLDADEALYNEEGDRNLLFVAITRAMHELTILYRNQPAKALA